MALFGKTNQDRTPEQLAMSYASADWHNVKGTLDIMGIEYDEDTTQQALFDYKLGLILAKQERKFGKNINSK